MPRFRIAVGAHRPHTSGVVDALTRAGWEETGGLDWDLYWATERPDQAVFRAAGARRVNFLKGSSALANKAALHEQVVRARRRLAIIGRAEAAGVELRTFVMPDDYDAWRTAVAWEPDTWWIRKPAGLSRGRGVALVHAPSDVTPEAGWVVQEYVAPHLLDGYKYTLRLYLLVTSIDPCVAFLHRDGFAKLASRPFRRNDEGRCDRFANLTNPDVLREDESTAVSARNLTLDAYLQRLDADGVDAEDLWRRIRRSVAVVVMSAREAMRDPEQTSALDGRGCFELFGVDIAIDERMQPLVLECNSGPSLAVEADASTSSSRDERGVKQRVIGDTLHAIGALAVAAATRFEPLVPAPDLVDLLPCFDRITGADVAAWRDSARRAGRWEPLAAYGAVHAAPGDRVILYAVRTGEFVPLDPAASVMWLGLADGLSPDEVAAELRAAVPASAGDIADHAWLAMSNWVWAGLLGPAGSPLLEATPAADLPIRLPRWHDDPVFDVYGWRFVLRGPRSIVDVVRSALAGHEVLHAAPIVAGAIEVAREGDHEFVVIASGREIRCGALALASTIVEFAARRACKARGAVALTRVAVERRPSGAAIHVHAEERDREWVFVRLASDATLELMTPTGERTALIGIVSPTGPAGVLEWLSADRTATLALDAALAPAFIHAVEMLRCGPARRPTSAHAATETR